MKALQDFEGEKAPSIITNDLKDPNMMERNKPHMYQSPIEVAPNFEIQKKIPLPFLQGSN